MNPRPVFLAALFLAMAGLALADPGMAGPAPGGTGDVAPAQPVIPARSFNVRDFGPAADGHTPDTEVFRRAIAAVDRAGGGHLVVPAGNYFTGPIDLCSNLDFHLEKGARLLFSQKFDDYRLSGSKCRPLLGAAGCHDVLVSGAGVLDGQGSPWWAVEWKAKNAARARGLYDAEIGRPILFSPRDCQRVRLEGVTLCNAPKYHFEPIHCEDVTVDGITIKSPPNSPNTDGIDPSICQRVLITHCTVDTGDDCVAVKGDKTGFGSDEDILVTDCTFLRGHGCAIGSDTVAGVRRMTVRRCVFDGTDIGVRLKSGRDRGGLVEDITYTDLTMRNVGEAIVVSSYYYGLPKHGVHDPAQPVTSKTPRWRHIVIRNITADDGTKDAGLIMGLPEMPVEDITLDHVRITAPKGLRIGCTRGIALRHVNVYADGEEPFVIEDSVEGLVRK